MIELEQEKSNHGVGFVISGGRSTGVVVQRIYHGSRAHRDGRLQLGDHLLQVGKFMLHGFSSEQVAVLLRHHDPGPVKIVVARPYVHGQSVAKERLAIAHCSSQQKEIRGIFVKNLVPASVAEKDGRIKIGDLIIEVNGCNLEALNHAESVKHLVNSGLHPSLKLVRFDVTSAQAHYLGILQQQERANHQQQNSEAPPHGLTEDSTLNSVGDVEMNFNNNSTEEELLAFWQPIVGSDRDVVIANLGCCVEGAAGMGLSLEGTVDVVQGTEVRPHHYIQALQTDSAAERAQLLRIGDELLEVNGIRLFGRSHLDVVNALSQLPINASIRLVVARLVPRIENDKENKKSSPYSVTTTCLDGPILKAKSEIYLNSTSDGQVSCEGGIPYIDSSPRKVRCQSLDTVSSMVLWSTCPTVIWLHKTQKGLGFSIAEYQDYVFSAGPIIVIRALVPGGAAAHDGRIQPGDRLLFVNDTNLSNVPMENAVAALKSAPRGLVKLGLAKPLSFGNQSQGLTLRSIVVDLSAEVFQSGMAYVALSRVKSLEGVYLLDLNPAVLYCDELAAKQYIQWRKEWGIQGNIGSINQRPSEFQERPYNLKKRSAAKCVSKHAASKALAVSHSALDSSAQCATKLSASKSSVSFVLLANPSQPQRTSCYANVVIQCLRQMPHFLRCAKDWLLIEMKRKTPGVSQMALQTINELYRLCTVCDSKVQSTNFLRKAISISSGHSDYANLNLEEDAHGLFDSLIQTFPAESLVTDLFSFNVETTLVCTSCPIPVTEVPRLETCTSISLPCGQNQTFAQLVDKCTSPPPLPSYYCQQCKRDTVHNEKINFLCGSHQKYLIVLTSLFTQDCKGGAIYIHNRKITNYVANKMYIKQFNKSFRTVAAVNRIGESPTAGHYTCWVREGNGWLLINDDKVTREQSRFVNNLRDIYNVVFGSFVILIFGNITYQLVNYLVYVSNE